MARSAPRTAWIIFEVCFLTVCFIAWAWPFHNFGQYVFAPGFGFLPPTDAKWPVGIFFAAVSMFVAQYVDDNWSELTWRWQSLWRWRPKRKDSRLILLLAITNVALPVALAAGLWALSRIA